MKSSRAKLLIVHSCSHWDIYNEHSKPIKSWPPAPLPKRLHIYSISAHDVVRTRRHAQSELIISKGFQVYGTNTHQIVEDRVKQSAYWRHGSCHCCVPAILYSFCGTPSHVMLHHWNWSLLNMLQTQSRRSVLIVSSLRCSIKFPQKGTELSLHDVWCHTGLRMAGRQIWTSLTWILFSHQSLQTTHLFLRGRKSVLQIFHCSLIKYYDCHAHVHAHIQL